MPVAKPKTNASTRSIRRPEPLCLYSVKEVAEQCGLSEKTVRRMIDARKLRAQRAGRSIRITHAELLAFLGLSPNAAR